MSRPNGFEFDAYLVMLADPFYAEYSAAQFAESLGVSTNTVYGWNKKVNWDEVKATRRKNYAKQTMVVDSSLFKSAKKGDVAAIRTWYERFDDWTPTTKQQTEHSISEADVDRELNALAERKRALIGALDNSGRGEVALPGAGEAAPAEGRADEVLPAQPGSSEVHSGDSQGGEVHRG